MSNVSCIGNSISAVSSNVTQAQTHVNYTPKDLHIINEKAIKVKNPLEPFEEEFSKFVSPVDDSEFTIKCKWKNDLNPKMIKWALRLAERNVGPFYRTCTTGWLPKVKEKDLNKHWARYLIAYDAQKNPVAYSMFRFDIDFQCCVLYCYEMQIEKEHQRKGLGSFMMTILEKISNYNNMEKVVLTVLKNNLASIEFFKKLGYTLDHTTPDEELNEVYQIMKK